MEHQLYNLFSRAMCYPEPSSLANAQILGLELKKIDQKYFDQIIPFINYLASESQEILKEAYTNTFDIQAVCPLEIGYTLFGEDYKRGEFLVRISDMHHEYGTNLISSELADYLPNVLNLMAKMPDCALKKEFIEKLVQPALLRMLEKFDEKKGINPFSLSIKVLNEYLSSQYTMNNKVLEAQYE